MIAKTKYILCIVGNTVNKIFVPNFKSKDFAFLFSVVIFVLLIFACGSDKKVSNNNNNNYNNNSNYENGLTELEKKNYSQAETYFKKVKKKDKNYNEAISKLNYIYGCQEYEKKNYNLSLEYFKEVTSADIYIYKANDYIKKIDYILNKMEYAFDLYDSNNLDSALKIIEKVPVDDFDHQKAVDLKNLIYATLNKQNGHYDSSLTYLERIPEISVYSNISEDMTIDIKSYLDSSNYNKGISFLSNLEFDSSKYYLSKVFYLLLLEESSKLILDSIENYKDTILFSKLVYYCDKGVIDSAMILFGRTSESSKYYYDSKNYVHDYSNNADRKKLFNISGLFCLIIILLTLALFNSKRKAQFNNAILDLRNLFLLTNYKPENNIEHLIRNIASKYRINNKRLKGILTLIFKDDIVNNKNANDNFIKSHNEVFEIIIKNLKIQN